MFALRSLGIKKAIKQPKKKEELKIIDVDYDASLHHRYRPKPIQRHAQVPKDEELKNDPLLDAAAKSRRDLERQFEKAYEEYEMTKSFETNQLRTSIF